MSWFAWLRFWKRPVRRPVARPRPPRYRPSVEWLEDRQLLSTVTLVTDSATWKYLDNGSDQGTAWRGVSFDASTWKSGTAQLGYGDGDEKALVGYGSDAGNKYITTYFRKTFSVTDPSLYDALTLNLMRDDGAVVYLNGTEVFRSNMPTGTISYLTRASTAVAGADESTWFAASIDPALLRAGTNVLAVEIHQNLPSSSDITFNARLTANESSTIALPKFGPKQLKGYINTSKIDEASGLAASRVNTNVLWTHNDSGDSARIFAINTSAKLLATYNLWYDYSAGKRVPANDYEDIAIGPGPVAGKSYIYVADIGDNGLSRSTVEVYRFLEPTVTTGLNPPSPDQAPTINVSGVEKFSFRYCHVNSDGSRSYSKVNAESLTVDPVTGDLFIVAKSGHSSDASNMRRVYWVPASKLQTPSATPIDAVHVATIKGAIGATAPNPTGADISADGSLIAIKNYGEVMIWVRQPGQSVIDVLKQQPQAPVVAGVGSGGEAITFAPTGSGFYTLTEGQNQPLYYWPKL